MKTLRRLLLVAVILCVPNAWGQSNKREPRVGYLYPAGGRQSSVFQITAGGQFLRGVSDAYVSGEGVRLRYRRPTTPARPSALLLSMTNIDFS